MLIFGWTSRFTSLSLIEIGYYYVLKKYVLETSCFVPCMHTQSESVLLSSLSSGGQVEGWASVQCLACAGISSAPVVEELMMHVQDQSRAGKASRLLANLSSKTVCSVHGCDILWSNQNHCERLTLHTCTVLCCISISYCLKLTNPSPHQHN